MATTKKTTVKGKVPTPPAKKKAQTPADKGKKNTKSTGAASNKKDIKKTRLIEDLVVEEFNAITVELPLTEHEIVIVSREMEGQMTLKEQLESDLKKIQIQKKGEISGVSTKIEELRKIVSTGKRKTVVQAAKVRNFMTTMVMFINKDADPNNLKPEDIYKQEPFSEWDYQLKIRMENGEDIDSSKSDAPDEMFSKMATGVELEEGKESDNVEDHTEEQEETID